MSLATRCTVCGTVFRVVQDQLKVSEGWVRCGRCDGVFNAIEGLFDLERDAPPNWIPPAAAAPPAAAITASFQAPLEPPEDEDDVLQLSDEDRIHSRFFQPEQEDVAQTPAQALAERDRLDFADARFNDALLAEEETGIETAPADLATTSSDKTNTKSRRSSSKKRRSNKSGSTIAAVAAQDAAKKSAQEAAKKQAPEFLQAAQRQAFWRSPAMGIALWAMAAVLSLGLASQIVFQFRDHLAARWPSSASLLNAMCRVASCHIEPLQRIKDITLENNALSPGDTADSYRLALTFRNRNTLPLAVPAVELSLSDPAGRLVARRAIRAHEFQIDTQILAPNSETNVQINIATNDYRIGSYTVELFYP
jgi:predicted Zn finger-like uncharacterized protein